MIWDGRKLNQLDVQNALESMGDRVLIIFCSGHLHLLFSVKEYKLFV